MTVAARLTLVETAVARLIVSRGPRVSELLKQARARQGEGAPAPLYDIAVLEQDAKLPGLRGALAKARLRMIRGVAPEALLAGMVAGKEADLDGGRGNHPAAPRCEGSTAPETALQGPSEIVARIDALLLRAGGHV